jgi:hypothetical protein
MPVMKKSTFILAAALVAGFAACSKQSVQTTYDKQETYISGFVESVCKQDTTATVTYKNGAVRIVVNDTLEREGLMLDTLSMGGTASFHYAGYILSGSSVSNSNLFATNHKETADAAGWAISDTTAFRIMTLSLDDRLLDGLRYGLEGVRNQDECYILFSGKFAFGSHGQGTIPARSALVYHIWVNSISND